MDPVDADGRPGRRVHGADDLDAAFATIGGSSEPFDRWFRDHIRQVHGISLEEGCPPPELVLDFRADTAGRP
jgi:hypothetical protein